MFEQQEVDANCRRKLFSDEASFLLFGYDNKQNWIVWGYAKSSHDTQYMPERLLSGTYNSQAAFFVVNGEGQIETFNDVRYRLVTTDYHWHQSEDLDVEVIWFQQDGASCHTPYAEFDVLRQKFRGRIIPHYGDINWQP